MKEQIREKISNILNIDKENVSLEKPKDRTMGDYAIPCFTLSKVLHKSPIDISNYLKDNIDYKCEAVNGYLNIFVDRKEVSKELLEKILLEKNNYGNSNLLKNKKIVIEYSSPNIAKPFGVGHLRSTVIGEALKNLSLKNGADIISINYLGDYGTQFGKLLYAYKTWGNKEEVLKNPIVELKRLYVKFHDEASNDPSLDDMGRLWFKKLEENDSEALELWTWFKDESLKEFNKTYKLLKIDKFDSYDGEAYYKDKMKPIIEEMENKHLLQISEGATIIDLGDIAPALIKRSDGGSLYITRDVAALLDRKNKYNFDEILYVVGNEQSLHFKQLKMIIDKMGYDFSDKIKHINFGMVLQGGKKMSTRAGKTVSLDSVLEDAINLAYKYIEEKNSNLENKKEVSEKIGVGAVIFNDLKNYRINDIEFDLDEILKFEGNTGPYVQYTYARINSLLDKKTNKGLEIDSINEYEWNVIWKLYEFKDIIENSYKNYDPSNLAKYVLDLCQDFNRMYANIRVLDENELIRNYRLMICEATQIVIGEAMRLLGISVINKM